MTDNMWDNQLGAMSGANAFATLNTLYLLIEKGIISNQEAARVFTKTAQQVREATEDGASPATGEKIATIMETMAGWCLGYSSSL